MKQNIIGKKVKMGIAAAALIVVAGVSVYATGVSADAGISEAEAKQIALSEVAGADVSNITKFKKDQDDGRTEYDVEIVYDGYEYEFEISAEDGTIYDRSKEAVKQSEASDKASDKNSTSSRSESSSSSASSTSSSAKSAAGSSSNSSSSEISLEKAKSIALAQVSGATAGDIVKAEKDYDDGYVEYEIEIWYDGYEYEFEISAATGGIIGKDVERIDYDD